MLQERSWSRDEGVALCRLLETVSPQFGAHVALTGGLLYRDGLRKDCDILVYRIRQFEKIDWNGLWVAWAKLGLQIGNDYGWCCKAKFRSTDGVWKDVDLFDPEDDGEYGAYGDFEEVTVP